MKTFTPWTVEEFEGCLNIYGKDEHGGKVLIARMACGDSRVNAVTAQMIVLAVNDWEKVTKIICTLSDTHSALKRIQTAIGMAMSPEEWVKTPLLVEDVLDEKMVDAGWKKSMVFIVPDEEMVPFKSQMLAVAIEQNKAAGMDTRLTVRGQQLIMWTK